MPFIIEEYQAGWKPAKNEGRIIFTSTDDRKERIDIGDPAEFAAILTLLATSEKALIDDNRIIWTGTEPVEE